MNSKCLKMKIKKQPNKILQSLILIIFATVLFTGIFMLIKYFVVTLLSLQQPVFIYLQMFLSDKIVENSFLYYVFLVLKILSLVVSAGLIFVIYAALSSVLSLLFYKISSWEHKTIEYPLEYAFAKGFRWNIYRLFLVFGPALLIITGTSILAVFSVAFFSFILSISGLSIALATFISSFVFFSLVFLFIISLFIGLWQIFFTCFGIEAAVSEPKLQNKIIKNRSTKVIYSRPFNKFLFACYFLFIFVLLIQLKLALTTDLLTNSGNSQLINSLIAFNVMYFVLLKFLKSAGYINSLLERYKKLPKPVLS